MLLKTLNQLPAEDMSEAFSQCCGASRWVRLMQRRAPFENEEILLQTAESIWYEECKDIDWLEAFTHHPKIGDLDSLKKKFASTQQWAGEEQAGINAATQSTIESLAEGNRAYEQKFGYIFIVCATGKTAEEMLNLLEDRSTNTPAEEILVARDEQHKITILRLQKLLNS